VEKFKVEEGVLAGYTADDTLDFYRKEQADGSKDKPTSF